VKVNAIRLKHEPGSRATVWPTRPSSRPLINFLCFQRVSSAHLIGWGWYKMREDFSLRIVRGKVVLILYYFLLFLLLLLLLFLSLYITYFIILYIVGRRAQSVYRLSYRAGRSGIQSWWGRDFPSVQTGLGAHPASCEMGTGSFPGVKCGRGVLLTTHPLLVPRSWKSRAIPQPTVWATPGL